MKLQYNNCYKKSGHMSVHQLIAYHTLLTLFKAIRRQEPVYLANKFTVLRPDGNVVRARRGEHNIRVDYKLSIARGGFVYRGAQL